MSMTEEVIVPALHRMKLTFFRSDAQNIVVVPFDRPDHSAGALLYLAEADDEANTIVIIVKVTAVPTPRRTAMALHLATLNQCYPFITFSMTEAGQVHADTSIDLTFTADREALFALSLARFVEQVRAAFGEIIQVASPKGRRRPSRVEREVAELLNELDDLAPLA